MPITGTATSAMRPGRKARQQQHEQQPDRGQIKELRAVGIVRPLEE